MFTESDVISNATLTDDSFPGVTTKQDEAAKKKAADDAAKKKAADDAAKKKAADDQAKKKAADDAAKEKAAEAAAQEAAKVEAQKIAAAEEQTKKAAAEAASKGTTDGATTATDTLAVVKRQEVWHTCSTCEEEFIEHDMTSVTRTTWRCNLCNALHSRVGRASNNLRKQGKGDLVTRFHNFNAAQRKKFYEENKHVMGDHLRANMETTVIESKSVRIDETEGWEGDWKTARQIDKQFEDEPEIAKNIKLNAQKRMHPVWGVEVYKDLKLKSSALGTKSQGREEKVALTTDETIKPSAPKKRKEDKPAKNEPVDQQAKPLSDAQRKRMENGMAKLNEQKQSIDTALKEIIDQDLVVFIPAYAINKSEAAKAELNQSIATLQLIVDQGTGVNIAGVLSDMTAAKDKAKSAMASLTVQIAEAKSEKDECAWARSDLFACSFRRKPCFEVLNSSGSRHIEAFPCMSHT